jgi:FG-GAP repeat
MTPRTLRRALRAAVPGRLSLTLHPPHPVLLGLACALLLSGCALVPFAQEAGSFIVVIATALGLAACGSSSSATPPPGETPPPPGQTTPPPPKPIVWPSVVSLDQLTSDLGFFVDGEALGDRFGFSVAAGQDVNGDGNADLVIGAPYAAGQHYDYNGCGPFSSNRGGKVYLVFGDSKIAPNLIGTDSPNSITNLGATQGVVFSGTYAASAGFSLALAKDVNGNGKADILIGAPHQFGGEGYYSVAPGAAWVVFGDSSLGGSRVLSNSGSYLDSSLVKSSQGFAITNQHYYYNSSIYFGGRSYASVGKSVAALDINGDTFSDVVAGAPVSNESSRYVGLTSSTYTWVSNPRVVTLFGKNGLTEGVTGTRDVGNTPLVPGDGFQFAQTTNFYKTAGYYTTPNHLSQYGHSFGSSLAAGDVNGDGVDDLIIGAPGGLPVSGNYGGAVVVFGQSGSSPTWPTALTASSLFTFVDNLEGSKPGKVAYLGDVNGDGIGDFAIIDQSEHAVFVVFGKMSMTGTLNASDLDGTNGFRIDVPYGGSTGDFQVPTAVAGADVNNDGTNDILILVNGGDTGTYTVGHVIFGKTGLGSDNNGVMDLSTPLASPDGLSITSNVKRSGYDNALAVGDVNGDGWKDLIIGLPSAYYTSAAGRVYVIFAPPPQ